ncbi:MAG: beta-galactosidase [Pedobacter sp.]|uniref:beta-galactosidase n=1 Tax=Pedobacter sp. TaxID=1411316 RepID=UPI00280719F5|nr:beta-galactosidase [Pedobacter sp.]MDQ8004165.1 beta-galactosidase [Pedobacter sp.]
MNHFRYLFIAFLSLMLVAFKFKEEPAIYFFKGTDKSIKPIVALQNSVLKLQGNALNVQTKQEEEAPGIEIKGNWDLSKCNQLVLEITNHDLLGDLPLTVVLENKGASMGKRRGVFLERIYIAPNQTSKVSIALPNDFSKVIDEQLVGMRMTPFTKWGLISNIDLKEVVSLSVYVNKPRYNWNWSVNYIKAEVGEKQANPAWMSLQEKEFFPFIDQYGQFKYQEWPGKIHSDQELKDARQKELASLEKYAGPTERSKFGGWKNGPKLKATGSFRVEKIEGKWWMVDPEGYLFWSHGVVRVTPHSGITPLDGRKHYFSDLPKKDNAFAEFYTTHDELLKPYYTARNIDSTYDFSAANIKRKYGENWREIYADLAHQRLKSWGLNTIANSSDKQIFMQRKTAYTDRIELKSPYIEGSKGMWWKFNDPFDPQFTSDFRRQLLEREKELNDPWCLGFFVDNEINWGEEATLAEWTLQSPATQAAKIAFVETLKTKYKTIQQLNTAWKTSFKDWQSLLESREKAPLGSKVDCIAFSKVITEEYFKKVRTEFKKVAPNKLYLGCRFARSNINAVTIGAKYCDVMSYNIYAQTLDNFKLPNNLDKPVLIGEFHFGALDRGLFHPSLIKTKNQEERGQAYFNYVKSALKHPSIIGTHWHQFADQATTGRFDGENFQVGMVDICDTPYWETIEKVREIGYSLYETREGKTMKKNKSPYSDYIDY